MHKFGIGTSCIIIYFYNFKKATRRATQPKEFYHVLDSNTIVIITPTRSFLFGDFPRCDLLTTKMAGTNHSKTKTSLATVLRDSRYNGLDSNVYYFTYCKSPSKD